MGIQKQNKTDISSVRGDLWVGFEPRSHQGEGPVRESTAPPGPSAKASFPRKWVLLQLFMHSECSPKVLFTSQNILLNNVKWPTKAKKLNVNGEILSLQHPTVAFWKKRQKTFWVPQSMNFLNRNHHISLNSVAAKSCPLKPFSAGSGGAGWRWAGVPHCHWPWMSPLSVLSQQRDLPLELIGQSRRFPTTSAPNSRRGGYLGASGHGPRSPWQVLAQACPGTRW